MAYGIFIVYDSLTGKVEEFVHGHKACVRDVSWHPHRNEILTSSVCLFQQFSRYSNTFFQWDGVVGQWKYVDKELVQNKVSKKARGGQSSDSQSKPVRRSLRIALKKRE